MMLGSEAVSEYVWKYSNVGIINFKQRKMNLPTGNFFEVTINSQKLFQFIEDINKQLKYQDTQLTALASKMNGTVSAAQEEARAQGHQQALQIQKLRKTLQEEVNYMRLFMRDVDKKTSERVGGVEETITVLKGMIVRQKKELEEDMAIKYSYLDKKIGYMSVLEEELSNVSLKLEGVKLTSEKNKETVDKVQEHTQFDIGKLKENFQLISDKVSQQEQELKNECEQMVSMRNSFMVDENVRPAKQKSKQRSNQQENQAFINIMNRMEEVEQKIAEPSSSVTNLLSHRRSIISNNKIVKSNTNVGHSHPKSQFGRKENQGGSFQSLMLQKLSRLQEMQVQKMGHLEHEVLKYSNKAEIVDEHIGILSRKLEKEKFKLVETSQQIKHFEDKRIDERTIENLKNMIKKLAKDLEENIEVKLAKEDYQQDKNKVEEKVKHYADALADKADKSEVKKGLTFLEDKIREIIIVLADERGTLQDGAIKKTPYKCLSCDKDLETEKETKLMAPIASNQRSNTQQVKKRIRMLNNTVTTAHQEE